MKVLHVVATRPNLMKVAPVMQALSLRGVRQVLVHTGQHYDVNMSDAILRELRIPEPDVNFGIGGGTHAEQMASVLLGMERTLAEQAADLVVVYGDTNSTLAATLAASEAGIPVAHVEAGLRSGDLTALDERNRVLTDRLAAWHFTPSADADANLRAEGIGASSIHRVGNVMIDTLVRLMPLTQPRPLLEIFGLMNGMGPRPYALVTLRRPETVDDDEKLDGVLESLTDVAAELPVVFPVHPRTRARMKDHQLQFSGLLLTEPLTYLQFLGLQRHAAVVITDSGGIQEETTYLGVPCLTVRDATDRPITVEVGTNVLVGDVQRLRAHVHDVVRGQGKRGGVPPLWDGRAAERIAEHVTADAAVLV